MIMELPVIAHHSPIVSFSAHYFGGFDSSKESLTYASDNSMDAEVHDVLKIKETSDEDLFSWNEDLRSLDGEKEDNIDPSVVKLSQHSTEYTYNKRSAQTERDLSQVYGKQEFAMKVPNQQDRNCVSRSLYNDVQLKEFDIFPKNQNQMGNKEEENHKNSGQYPKICGKTMGKGGNTVEEDTVNEVRSEIDLFLEKSQMAATGNQVEAATSSVIRKRKMETSNSWTTGKVSRMGASNNQREITTSRMSSDWQDLDVDLSNELSTTSYNMGEDILSLPPFKEEAPSPTGANTSPQWLNRQNNMMNGTMVMTSNCGTDQQNNGVVHMQGQNCQTRNQTQGMNHGNTNQVNQMMIQQGHQQLTAAYQTSMQMQTSTQNNEQTLMDVTSGLMMCNSIETFGTCVKPVIQALPDSAGSPDNRFQYVLAAATSIATKCNEDTLTYLNQCQSYEIKLKKLGDLSHFRGKILKSVIRICFHERRLQYAEREQMAQWQNERPGERIVEVDVPLSYGLVNVIQPTEQPLLNTVEVYWDPVKEAGVYIKVNCISTEFTAKKHGGEKGVPFRIQVETFLPGDFPQSSNGNKTQPEKRLHAAACQIKVFKLKGADRKHKQDREKILRRPECEREKYQPSYECTVFTDLPLDSVFSPISMQTNQPYSPDGGVNPSRPSAPSSTSPPRIVEVSTQLALTSPQDVKVPTLSRVNSHGSSLDCDEDNMGRNLLQGSKVTPGCEYNSKTLTEHATTTDTRAWLTRNRFSSLVSTFVNFSGADLLRLSRDDLIQLTNLFDGIRLYNAMHSEHTPARLTLYAKKVGEKPFTAIYLKSYQAFELKKKLLQIVQDGPCMIAEGTAVYVSGPNGIMINLTNEFIQNIRNHSMFCLDVVDEGIVMKPA